MKARTRRIVVSRSLLLVLGTVLMSPAPLPAADDGPVIVTDRAMALHRSCLLIDGHNDLPWEMRQQAGSSFDRFDIAQPQSKLQTDIPRLREGGLGAQFWSAYVPAHPPDNLSPAACVLEQIDLIYRMARRYPDTFEMAVTADDVERIHRDGRIACLIGVEGGHVIENSLAALGMLRALGARYITLTHGDTNDWCDSATDRQPHGGLTVFGEEVVREMNRLGILVDISHISADAMRDALRVSTAPVIASHSGAMAVAPHARNVPDDVLKLVARSGGVVMVNFFSGYLHAEGVRITERIFDVQREYRERYPNEEDYKAARERWKKENPIPRGTVRQVVDHIDHIVRVAGIDHVGIGSDFDGVGVLPEQLDDVSCYPYITQVLLDRGYSDDDVRKVLGGNILRALREAERVARELSTAPQIVRFDLLIRGGTVVDGTGSPPRRADVLVAGDRIVRVGEIDASEIQVDRTIDASGLMVCPGFIDTHAHGDPLATPAFENSLAMGAITICLGQDGESPAPDKIEEWMRRVEQAGPGPNIATFVGHGTIREAAGVGTAPDPSPEQVAAMQQLVGRALAVGCFGLSTGLEYVPGRYAGLDELAALAEPVGRAGGLVMSHMRSEDDDRIEGALAELLAQGRRARCAVHVSHLKVTYGHGSERAEKVLAQLDAARRDGLGVTADMYPYWASHTGIGIVFPEWALAPNDYKEVVRSRRAELADYLRRRVALRNGPEATLFGTGLFAGKTLAQAAAERGKPFEDVLIDDLGPNGASAAYFVMDAALQERFLVDPHVMICSDGSPTMRHPRGHGTFARIISEYVVKRKLLSIEEAIRKMTGLPAATLGLDRLGRGRLAPGFVADLLVFDPNRIHDRATFEDPHQPAEGFDCIIINGRVIRDGGRFTGQRAGCLLRAQYLSR